MHHRSNSGCWRLVLCRLHESLGDSRIRSLFYNVLLLIAIAGGIVWCVENVTANLSRQNIATGFDFLGQRAGFEIGESPISYSSADTYMRALLVGLLNTVKISLLGIFTALLLGLGLALAKLSVNPLIRVLAVVPIEVLRNTPLLLQLFFWYMLLANKLPPVRESFQFGKSFFINNRGFFIPEIVGHPGIVYGLLATLLVAVVVNYWQKYSIRMLIINLFLFSPFVFYVLYHWPLTFDFPRPEGFSFEGGSVIRPEFLALYFGLAFYTASFIAEIIRGGIESVPSGQREAAVSLGLSPFQTMQKIIIPQAMRVIIPPLTGQMLNLTKNSSLAIAIGYPDFVAVANTGLNQTGQAIEFIAIIMAVYLSLSLLTSFLMNWYHRVYAERGGGV